MKRDIELKNGYSTIGDTSYNVMNMDNIKDNFIEPYDVNLDNTNSKNIVPYTSRRDFMVNNGTKKRALELYTGTPMNYHPKKEARTMFEPLADITWVNGMPSITDNIEKRYLPSNKNRYNDKIIN